MEFMGKKRKIVVRKNYFHVDGNLFYNKAMVNNIHFNDRAINTQFQRLIKQNKYKSNTNEQKQYDGSEQYKPQAKSQQSSEKSTVDDDKKVFDDQKEYKIANKHTSNGDKFENTSIVKNEEDIYEINESVSYENTDDSCDDIQDCQSVVRIITELQYFKVYNDHENDNSNKISRYFNIHKHKQILNDYSHILMHHLNSCEANNNEILKCIYEKIMDEKNNLACNICDCKMYIRNNRIRENDYAINYDKETKQYMDLLDSIHSYFLHSLDLYNDEVIHEHNAEEEKNDTCNMFVDLKFRQMKTYLNEKTKNMKNIRGTQRMTNNKFVTATNEESAVNSNDFCFGQYYDYWGGIKKQKLKPKYLSLKEEITQNKIFCLNVDIFKDAMQKSADLLALSNHIKSLKCSGDYFTGHVYKITTGNVLDLNNILSLKLYTDYDTLSGKFSSTFRKGSDCKSDEDLTEKNLEFGNWSKILAETVNCFGKIIKYSSTKVFYHGISFLYIGKFLATFNAPTSTTTKLQIATIFAKHDGIILELNTYDPALRYFNCSFVSCYGYENERLFFHPPRHFMMNQNGFKLKFKSIRNVKTDENFERFMNGLVVLQKIVTVTGHISSLVSSDCIEMANNLIDSKISSKYIEKCMSKWSNNVVEMRFYTKEIQRYCVGLKIWELGTLIKLAKINKIFKNVQVIKCCKTGEIDAHFLTSLISEIKLVNKQQYSKIKKIQFGDVKRTFESDDFTNFQTLLHENGWIIENLGPYVILTR
eukprot:306109_1